MKRFFIGILFVLFVSHVYSQFSPFYFFQLTDPQFGMSDENKDWSKEIAILRKTIKSLNHFNPAFIVFTGDLVNDCKNQDQINDFKNVVGGIKSDIPVYFLPGNHDIDQNDVKESIDQFILNYGCDRFCFYLGNCCFIGLNTSIIRSKDNSLEQKQKEWLITELEKTDHCSHVILFGHHPFFVNDVNEKDSYQNIPVSKRLDYLELLQKNGVKNMFFGHLHYNKEVVFKNVNIVTTNSISVPLGEDKIGFRVVKVYPDRIVSEYLDLESLPKSIDL